MSAEQIRLVFVVYMSSIIPLILIPVLHKKRRIPLWVLPIYVASFLSCAIGWELWFTYGWIDGDPVNLRRAAALNTVIPTHLNWILNSLADAGSICILGLLIIWRHFGNPNKVFLQWNWRVFLTLFVWFIGQNIFVEMFLYHDQLAVGKPLSWAPFSPAGPWFNPTLFQFNDRTITLQGQLPWIIMSFIFYRGLLYYFQKKNSSVTGESESH